MNSSEIQRLFGNLPGLYLVVRPDADFTIVGASADYMRATFTDPGMFGRKLFEVFPDNPADPDATGVKNVTASFREAMASGKSHTMAPQRYDVRPEGGDYEERYWIATSSPLFDAQGRLEYLVQTNEIATDKGKRDAIAAYRAQVLADSERQKRIYETALNSTPDFVYVFDTDHRALYANDALLKTWGVADVRGKTWIELGYEQWHADMHDRELDTVIRTRAPIRGEIPFTGTGGKRMYDYIFAPVFDASGAVVAVAGTTRDITDRQAVEQSIKEQAARLAASDRAKDDFLATLSHELRNPLAPLRNAIALLRRGLQGEKLDKIHGVMERQVNQLVRLVDDLLEVSRISRGMLSLRKERVELSAVLRTAAETSHPLIQAAGHRLLLDLPPEPLWVDGDAVRLAQVLSNLLNNAASYMDAGGAIEVTVRRDGDGATIRVKDGGVGIEPAMIAHMFEMFSRGNRDSARNQGGLGIGLALARRLTEMHGGTLDAQSEGLGKGAEFTVRLPLAASGSSEAATQPEGDVRLDALRVLVVDDNVDAGDTLAVVLDTLGAEVRVARNGVDALEIFAAYKPAIVLLDIGMPVMNGYEVARAIRSRFADSAVALVALTGWGQEDDRQKAREAGFDHHVTKPAQVEALQLLLASLGRSA